MSAAPIIHAHELVKSFGPHRAVDAVSLAVPAGGCFGLLGPNGAGKSTLISLIYGLTVPSAGQLTVFGLDPARQSRAVKKRLGVVTQADALDDSLTVIENMQIYAAFVGLDRRTRDQRISELLEFMNLGHKSRAPIRTLSGGMKRRLVFVRALLNDPELIILDEPTTGLDPAVRHLLWGKVNQLKALGKTILLTTHYMHEAEMLCDELVIMNQGRVVRQGSPARLRAELAPGFVGVFDARDDHAALTADARARHFDVFTDASGTFVRAPEMQDVLGLSERHARRPALLRPSNLEDVFLKLTGQELNVDA